MEKDYIPLNPVPIIWPFSTLGIFIISGITVGLSWELIPDPIPIHWGANGEPDDWIPKSVGHIIGFLALGGGILSAIAVIVPWLIHQNAKHAHRGLPKKNCLGN